MRIRPDCRSLCCGSHVRVGWTSSEQSRRLACSALHSTGVLCGGLSQSQHKKRQAMQTPEAASKPCCHGLEERVQLGVD